MNGENAAEKQVQAAGGFDYHWLCCSAEKVCVAFARELEGGSRKEGEHSSKGGGSLESFFKNIFLKEAM